ncbi:MAG: alpha-galactosidase [Verrucomicrobia bacterium]|nr:alpha-galactosidase [Verrucomicrobiota bacterium]
MESCNAAGGVGSRGKRECALPFLLAGAVILAVVGNTWAAPAPKCAEAIRYHADAKVFVIQTQNSTYAIERNEAGVLNNTYWGPRIERVEDLPVGEENRFNRALIRQDEKNHIRAEYVGWGGWFYGEPALKATFADGTRSLKLAYRDHNITTDDKSQTLQVSLVDPCFPIEVRLHYRIYSGLDLVDRWAVVTNKGKEPITLESVQSATWHVPRNRDYRLTHLSGDWGREHRIEHVDLTQTAIRLGSRTGLSGPHANPFFALDLEGKATEESGQVWFGALHWSGNWKIVVEKNNFGQTRVTGGIEDFDFSWHLKPGDAFTTPVFTGGYTAHGFGAMSRMFHRYQRAHLMRPNKANRPVPLIYNSWFAVNSLGGHPDEPTMTRIAQQAADVGIELFVMDSGWEKKLGDWTPHAERFPNGLKPLVDRVHKLGMKFGIWVELENAHPDSDLCREHPDWVMQSPKRAQTGDQRGDLLLNLARDDVRDHMLAAMDRLLRDNAIDYLKLDMNRYVSEPAWPQVPLAQQKEFWVRYVRNLYYIFETLQNRFPEVIFENCAAGGARIDLGMARIFERVNRSDNQDPLDMPALHEGYSYVYLPGTAGGGGHIGVTPNFVNKRITPLRYRGHVAMLGSCSVSLALDRCTPEEMAELKKYVALYKELCGIIHNGDLYRLRSPRLNSYSAFEYVSEDKERAVLIILGKNMQRAEEPYPTLPRIQLSGLKPDWLYSVEGGKRMSGEGLMNAGIGFRLTGDYDSRVIRIKRVHEKPSDKGNQR